MSIPVSTHATNEALLDLLKILVDKGSLTQEEYELLVNTARADQEKVEGIRTEAREEAREASEKVTKSLPKVTTNGKLVIEDQDGDWSFQPIGRIYWDNMWVDDDGSDKADGGIEESGSELRRARLGFQAKFMKVFTSKLELDFANPDEPSWKDVWIAYNNKNQWGQWWLKLGQQHIPFGHTTISSSKYMPLMRRPLFGDGPQRARNVGVAFRQDSNDENRWFFHTGFFLESHPEDDDEINTDTGGGEGIFYAVRAGGTPVYKDRKHLIHIGASYQYQQPNGDTFNNIDNALLTHIGDGDALEADFGNNTDEVNAFGAEVIGVWGPFHTVGEFVYWDVDDPDGKADLYAWAVDASWFFTGESMKYKKGAFSGISPKRPVNEGGWGAWQIAARFESMDLNDSIDIDGGEADVFTLGLNWYPVRNVRFMANWGTVLDFDCKDTTTISFDGCNTSADGAEPHALSFRGQVYW